MAIQSYVNQIGFGGGGSEFSFVNNNGGIGIDQSYINNNQTLFHHHHQYHNSQSLLASQMEKHKQEIDQIVKLQNERLRVVLQEQRKQEMSLILRKMEDKAFVLMTQKEQEITKAVNKNMELEDLLRKMEMENQNLQRVARENEAMVTKLNSTLEQVRATCQRDVTVEDEESICCGESVPEKKMNCLNCGSNGVTRVLFLPCRHLCCCVDCEVGLVVCPICNTLKKSRIEAFIF